MCTRQSVIIISAEWTCSYWQTAYQPDGFLLSPFYFRFLASVYRSYAGSLPLAVDRETAGPVDIDGEEQEMRKYGDRRDQDCGPPTRFSSRRGQQPHQLDIYRRAPAAYRPGNEK